MPDHPRRLPPAARATVAALMLPLAILGLSLVRPELLLDRAYSGAMTRAESQWTADPHGTGLRPASLAPATVRKPFEVGDRMIIDARGGTPEAIEITAIEQVDGATLGLDGVAFQMVTGRSEARSDDAVRFLFAVDSPAVKAGKAL